MLGDDQERRLFAGLCLFRADKRIKAQLQHHLAAIRRFTPFYTWMVSLLFAIEDDPAAYPFSSSERESRNTPPPPSAAAWATSRASTTRPASTWR